MNLPVIGGHSGVTIVPLISQCTPQVSFPQVGQLIHQIMCVCEYVFVDSNVYEQSVMIIGNSTWSFFNPVDSGYDCQVTV